MIFLNISCPLNSNGHNYILIKVIKGMKIPSVEASHFNKDRQHVFFPSLKLST